MGAGIETPLVIIDDAGGIEASLVAWARRRLAAQYGDVVFVVPRLVVRPRWTALFHDHTSDRIAFELRAIEDVRVVLVGVDG